MAVDGLHATRPVEFPVGRPEEAQGMFDVLTYQKGGSVLRMLEQFLGPDVFREGIHDYLTTHRLRQHRDRRPVGRPRALERAGRARHHGHLDQPGRLPAGPGGRGRVPDPDPVLLPGRAGRGHRLRLAGARCSPGPLADDRGRARPDPSCWTAPGPAADPAAIGAGPAGQRRRLGLLPGLLPHGHGRAPGRPARRPRPRSSATTWSRTPGPRPCPARPRWPTCCAWPGALADSGEGDPSVWSVVLGALGLFDRVVPDADRPVAGPAGAHPARPAGRRPRLGPPRRRRRAHPVPAVVGAPHPRAPSGTIPTSGPRRPRRVRRGRHRHPPSRHRVGRPGHRGRRRRRGRVRGVPGPLPRTRPTPRRRTATSTPWPPSTTPPWPPAPSTWP